MLIELRFFWLERGLRRYLSPGGANLGNVFGGASECGSGLG